MDADTSLFRLEQTAPTVGESLRVGVELPASAPWLKDVARVRLRLEGKVEYQNQGSHRSQELPGPPLETYAGPVTGMPRLSFTVTVPEDVPPSHVGEQLRVEWALVVTLQSEWGAGAAPRAAPPVRPAPAHPPAPRAAPAAGAPARRAAQ